MKDTPLFFPAVQILFPDNLMQIVREKYDKNEEKNDNNVEKNYENVVVDENMRPAISFYLAAEEYVAQHFAWCVLFRMAYAAKCHSRSASGAEI